MRSDLGTLRSDEVVTRFRSARAARRRRL